MHAPVGVYDEKVDKVEDARRYFHTMDLSTSVIIRRRRLERAARSHY